MGTTLSGMERGTANYHQSRKHSENNKNQGKESQQQSSYVEALSLVNEMPEDEKSKLFLSIFRDLSVTSKSTLLLDLLKECRAAGQVTNSPVTELIRDNSSVEKSDIDMRYENNK